MHLYGLWFIDGTLKIKMKPFQFSILELLIFVTLIGISFAGPLHFWREHRAEMVEVWGPNPGHVSF